MAVIIKDPDTDRLIRDLAGRTGETITHAVKEAVTERLQRLPKSEKELAVRRKKIAQILAKIDSMPTVDMRSSDEIIGYNDRGHFD